MFIARKYYQKDLFFAQDFSVASLLTLLCSFQLNRKGEESLSWGQNSRHSYPLATAPLCQQVILTEGQLSTTEL